jgi:hypothetical protein
MHERNLAPGLVLIGLGLMFGILQLTGVGGEAVVAIIGGALLVGYAVTRRYGYLVPGGILTGLGIGIIWQAMELNDSGGAVLVGLGAGFLSIYLIDRFVRRDRALWWPMIPGGITLTIGLLLETGREGSLAGAALLWPIFLVVIGGALLLSQLTSGPSRHGTPPADGG